MFKRKNQTLHPQTKNAKVNALLKTTDWTAVGEGSYNKVQVSQQELTIHGYTGRWVLKKPKDSRSHFSQSHRAVRKWSEHNPDYPALEVDGGWIAPYLGSEHASDKQISDKVIEIYQRTRNIIVDACVPGNFLVYNGTVICVDVDQSFRRGSTASDEFLVHYFDRKPVSYRFYDQKFSRNKHLYPQTITTLEVLTYLDKQLNPTAIKDEYLTPRLIYRLREFYVLSLPITPAILDVLVLLDHLDPANEIKNECRVSPRLVKSIFILMEQKVVITKELMLELLNFRSLLDTADLAEVKYRIYWNRSVLNQRDEEGYTLLHQAALNGQLDTVHYLIGEGADVNVRTWIISDKPNEMSFDKKTAIELAIMREHDSVVMYLYPHMAGLAYAQDGLIRCAARAGCLSVVQELVRFDPKCIDATDQYIQMWVVGLAIDIHLIQKENATQFFKIAVTLGLFSALRMIVHKELTLSSDFSIKYNRYLPVNWLYHVLDENEWINKKKALEFFKIAASLGLIPVLWYINEIGFSVPDTVPLMRWLFTVAIEKHWINRENAVVFFRLAVSSGGIFRLRILHEKCLITAVDGVIDSKCFTDLLTYTSATEIINFLNEQGYSPNCYAYRSHLDNNINSHFVALLLLNDAISLKEILNSCYGRESFWRNPELIDFLLAKNYREILKIWILERLRDDFLCLEKDLYCHRLYHDLDPISLENLQQFSRIFCQQSWISTAEQWLELYNMRLDKNVQIQFHYHDLDCIHGRYLKYFGMLLDGLPINAATRMALSEIRKSSIQIFANGYSQKRMLWIELTDFTPLHLFIAVRNATTSIKLLNLGVDWKQQTTATVYSKTRGTFSAKKNNMSALELAQFFEFNAVIKAIQLVEAKAYLQSQETEAYKMGSIQHKDRISWFGRHLKNKTHLVSIDEKIVAARALIGYIVYGAQIPNECRYALSCGELGEIASWNPLEFQAISPLVLLTNFSSGLSY